MELRGLHADSAGVSDGSQEQLDCHATGTSLDLIQAHLAISTVVLMIIVVESDGRYRLPLHRSQNDETHIVRVSAPSS